MISIKQLRIIFIMNFMKICINQFKGKIFMKYQTDI